MTPSTELKQQRVTVSTPRTLTFEVVASAGKTLEERPDGATGQK